MKIDIDKQLEVLKPEKQVLVLNAFAPIVRELNDFGIEYPEIQEMEQTPERSARAKRFRIDFKKVVKKSDDKRKELKEESLQEGRSIQSVHNHILEVTEQMLTEVMDIEQYYENLEKAEQEKLRKERLSELEKYEVDGSGLPLGEMESAIWENFLIGAKSQYEERQRAEKEEADRLAEESRIQDLHVERKESIINCWQFVLEENQNDNFGTWEQIHWDDFVSDLYQSKADYDKEQKQIREDNEKLRAENEKAETKRIADKKRSDNKLKKERESKQKLEDEKAEREETERVEKLKKENAPDKERLVDIVEYIMDCREGIKNKLVCELLLEIEGQIESLIEKM